MQGCHSDLSLDVSFRPNKGLPNLDCDLLAKSLMCLKCFSLEIQLIPNSRIRMRLAVTGKRKLRARLFKPCSNPRPEQKECNYRRESRCRGPLPCPISSITYHIPIFVPRYRKHIQNRMHRFPYPQSKIGLPRPNNQRRLS